MEAVDGKGEEASPPSGVGGGEVTVGETMNEPYSAGTEIRSDGQYNSRTSSNRDDDEVLLEYERQQMFDVRQSLRVNNRMTRTMQTRGVPKLIIALVGLPARGKSFIAEKIRNFLSWKGTNVQMFNVGQMRRRTVSGEQNADWFSSGNDNAKKTREKLASDTMDLMLRWIMLEGEVAIFDATNTTKSRRKILQDRVASFSALHDTLIGVIFLESICDDPTILKRNYMTKVLRSPDYKDMDFNTAMADLMKRIDFYMQVYETVEDSEGCAYVKLYNLQSKVHVNHIYGGLANSLLPYLMSIHVGDRPIYLARAGHCDGIQFGLKRMDSTPCVASRSATLSSHGITFAKNLARFIRKRCQQYDECSQDEDRRSSIPSPRHLNCAVFTSTLPRAVETAQFVDVPVASTSSLNPLDKGEAYGVADEEMPTRMPELYARWKKDPLRYRFPGGESYHDLVLRLETVLTDIEQQTDPVLVVSHISALQVLYCYFLGIPIEQCHSLEIPFHCVVELTPRDSHWERRTIDLGGDELQEAKTALSGVALNGVQSDL